MSHLRFYKWVSGCLWVCAAAWLCPAHAQMDTFGGDPSTNALVRIPVDTDDWTRHFRIGALLGLNIKGNFNMNGNSFPISGNNAGNGDFSQGNYVKKDATGDPNYTANWGYTSSSELNGGTLSLTGANTFAATGSSDKDAGLVNGFDLAYGANLFYWKHARVGWEMGFGWLPINIIDNEPLKASINETTYEFNAGNITVPQAPYTGNPNGTGPLIPLSPTNSFTTQNASGTVSGSHQLAVSLYTLRLGPSYYWDLSQDFSISASAGPAVGFTSGEYKYNEVINVNNAVSINSGKISGTDLVYGAYVSATLLYHMENHGDIYLGAQYMPMTDATLSGGGREGRLDLNGQVYLSLGINWPF